MAQKRKRGKLKTSKFIFGDGRIFTRADPTSTRRAILRMAHV